MASIERKTDGSLRKLAAALPVIYGEDGIKVVLITSKTTRRYIPTKGAIRTGEKPRHCAEREALEEAGVIGTVSRKPIAHIAGANGAPSVPLYLLTVETLLDDWAERLERERLVLTPHQAALLIDDPVLASVLLRIAAPEWTQLSGRSRLGKSSPRLSSTG